MTPDFAEEIQLPSQPGGSRFHVVAVGEVLWDVYEDSRRLGGAPLNFGAHARRLGHPVTLVSAVGSDHSGQLAQEMIASLGLDTRFLKTSPLYATGSAEVRTGTDGNPQFTIVRPAAYDAADLTPEDLQVLEGQNPTWVYYGTVFSSRDRGKELLFRLLTSLNKTSKFYDLNLRPGADSPALVRQLLLHADVVKMNEEELVRVAEFTGLPVKIEAFCREGTQRYGWQAVGITLGNRGCAMLHSAQYVEAAGHPVDVVDTVGAGDAFGAAFMHGISLGWSTAKIATFANRVGALVASRHGAIPDWTLKEAVQP